PTVVHNPPTNYLFRSTHRPPPTSTLFPYTTLFRSRAPIKREGADRHRKINVRTREVNYPSSTKNGHRIKCEAARTKVNRRSRRRDRKSTRLNSSHSKNSYAVLCQRTTVVERNLNTR